MYLCTAFTEQRDVAQLVSVHVWGACGRWFESSHPDLRTKKRSYDIAQQYRNSFFCAKSQLPIGGRASRSTTPHEQFIILNSYLWAVQVMEANVWMAELLSVVERGRSTSYQPAKIIKKGADWCTSCHPHPIYIASTYHLHPIYIHRITLRHNALRRKNQH